MKKMYEKSELWFALVWIAAYVVLVSAGDNLSAGAGIMKIVTLPILILLSAILLIFLKKNQLLEKYGLCMSQLPASKMLFYIPLMILLTANLWYGVALNVSVTETVLYILSMLCVGFLEEVIFRGLLFKAMAEDGIRAAVIVSSVTFGIGHIVNLFNGSGADLVSNMLQVVYAVAVGFAFVMIFLRTKSLLICIAVHGVFNSLSIFSDTAAITPEREIISGILIAIIAGAYAVYIALKVKEKNYTPH